MKQERINEHTEKLKPCPFCGGKARVGILFCGWMGIMCTNCYACMLSDRTMNDEYQVKEAVENWNMRNNQYESINKKQSAIYDEINSGVICDMEPREKFCD
jgi:hypothetical protein